MNTMMMKLGLGLAVVLTMAGCAAEAGDESAADEQGVSAPSIPSGGEDAVENAPSKRDMPMLAAPKHMLPVEKTGGEFGDYQPKLPSPGDPAAQF